MVILSIYVLGAVLAWMLAALKPDVFNDEERTMFSVFWPYFCIIKPIRNSFKKK